jgi:glycosyltransferase involved in cell wall biosynthesis
MKKILIINTTYNKGGAAKVAKSLFDNNQNNFDMYFAYGRGKKVDDKNALMFGNIIENFFHLILVRFFGLEGYGTYFSTKKLIKFIKKEKFDLINLHNLHGYYLDFFTLIDFIKKEKIPVIWTLHDEWPVTWLPAHSLGCEHCLSGKGICINTYSYPKNYFPFFRNYMLNKKHVLFAKNWSPVIVCPSDWLAKNISKSYLGDKTIKVIRNGVDTDLFVPRDNKNELKIKYNIPLDKKVIGFAAANLKDENKGLKYIIEVAEKFLDKPVIFLGLGAGIIKSHKNIFTTGYISDQRKVAEIFSVIDLFCSASSAETFSLTVAESMSCGVPVVGFDIPVIKEIVNEKTGRLTKCGEVVSLYESIKNLLECDEERFEKGIRSRETIVNNYSDKIFYKKYTELFIKNIL